MGKFIVAKGFKKLPKMQKIAQSGHTAHSTRQAGSAADAQLVLHKLIRCSVTRKKLPNVYKSCPKLISLEQLKILTTLQKLPKNVGDLGKSTVAKGFKKLPTVQ